MKLGVLKEITTKNKGIESYLFDTCSILNKIDEVIKEGYSVSEEVLALYDKVDKDLLIAREKAKQEKYGLYFLHNIYTYIDRKMVGHSIAELFSKITGDNFIYKENEETCYLENEHNEIYNIPFNKIAVKIALEKKTLDSQAQKDDILSQLDSVYENGKTIIVTNTGNSDNDFELTVNNYTSDKQDYNKIIDNFIKIIIMRSVDLNRDLIEEELKKLIEKYIKLYNLNYAFEYYEENMYKEPEKKEKSYHKILEF